MVVATTTIATTTIATTTTVAANMRIAGVARIASVAMIAMIAIIATMVSTIIHPPPETYSPIISFEPHSAHMRRHVIHSHRVVIKICMYKASAGQLHLSQPLHFERQCSELPTTTRDRREMRKKGKVCSDSMSTWERRRRRSLQERIGSQHSEKS